MDDGAIGWRRGRDGVLDEAGEAVGDAGGGTPIEAGDVFVEVGLQVLGTNCAVVRAQEPALGQAETRWMANRRSAASPQDRLSLIGSCSKPWAARPA